MFSNVFCFDNKPQNVTIRRPTDLILFCINKPADTLFVYINKENYCFAPALRYQHGNGFVLCIKKQNQQNMSSLKDIKEIIVPLSVCHLGSTLHHTLSARSLAQNQNIKMKNAVTFRQILIICIISSQVREAQSWQQAHAGALSSLEGTFSQCPPFIKLFIFIWQKTNAHT